MGTDVARRLLGRVTPPAGAATGVSDAAELAAVTSVLGPGAVALAVEVSRRGYEEVVDHIRGEPQLPLAELHRAIEQSGLDLLRGLAGVTDRFTLNTSQRTVVRELARHDAPFERMVRGLRIVQKHWTTALLDLVEQSQPARDRGTLLRDVMAILSRFFDDTVQEAVTGYMQERQRQLAQHLSSRRAMVLSIVGGVQVTAEAAHRTLGLDPALYHLAFLVWQDEQRQLAVDVHGELERTAREAAETLGCAAPLIVPEGDATLWAWATRPRPFPEEYPATFAAVQARPHPVRIAVGVPARGLDGFRRSHLAACDAHRVARSSTAAEPVVAYRDVGLAALLGADVERARWFVTEELAGLAAGDAATAELRQTLLSYLDCGRSLVRAAAALHLHRNTVVYRLRSIKRLLGHPVDERTQQVHAALTLAARLGPAVLRRAGDR